MSDNVHQRCSHALSKRSHGSHVPQYSDECPRAGDMLHVPARSWHQVLTEEGESITYALINVFK